MWFRQSKPSITELRDARPSQFTGFANNDPYLYEFRTHDGRVVRLHDGFFESLTYQVGVPPTVLFTFVFGEITHGSSDDAVHTAVANARVTFRFDDAFVLSWESSQEMPQYRSDAKVPHGQVHDFHRYAVRCFGLATIDDTIYVEATNVDVTIEALSAEAVEVILARIGGARR